MFFVVCRRPSVYVILSLSLRLAQSQSAHVNPLTCASPKMQVRNFLCRFVDTNSGGMNPHPDRGRVTPFAIFITQGGWEVLYFQNSRI